MIRTEYKTTEDLRGLLFSATNAGIPYVWEPTLSCIFSREEIPKVAAPMAETLAAPKAETPMKALEETPVPEEAEVAPVAVPPRPVSPTLPTSVPSKVSADMESLRAAIVELWKVVDQIQAALSTREE